MTEEGERAGSSPLLGSQDLHVHTTMSDGDLTLEEVVTLAGERGIQVGIADHVSARNAAVFVADAARLRHYLEALDAAPVFRSAELCWCDEFSSSLAEDVRSRFDYIIGSNHGFALPDGSFGSPWWRTLPPPWDAEPDRLMEIMVHNLCDMVRQMPIDIAAHPTFLPIALMELERDVHAWWSEEREDRFIEASVRAGVALEVSNRYRLPHPRFLRKAKEAGARFSLGSDGHQREQIARLDWAVQAARDAGIGDADLFIAERRT